LNGQILRLVFSSSWVQILTPRPVVTPAVLHSCSWQYLILCSGPFHITDHPYIQCCVQTASLNN